MNNITTRRVQCSFCLEEKTLEKLFVFKKFPVFMGCTKEPLNQDQFADMDFKICTKCGGVQLSPYVNPEVVYKAAHGSGTVGKSWNLHHQRFAKFISKYRPQEIFEIGASHNFLAKKYLESNDTTWNILDPNTSQDNKINEKIKIKKGFFSKSYKNEKKYECVVHSHTYEHFINIFEITRKFFNLLEDSGIMIFSVPNLQSHYEHLYTNVMNFEHSVFLSENMIDLVLKNAGFIIEEKQYHKNNHSIFYACRKNNNLQQYLKYNFYEANKQCLMNWYNYHSELARKLNKKINNLEGKIYLFGAHVSSQFLISFGLDTDKIVSILDNDPNKHNTRLYGTRLVCKSPKSELSLEDGSVILRAGVFSKDIEYEIIKNINKNIKFIKE
tara:strand:+ start:4541 stop:5692 length:1152 start_codon:yes stop_codon:yes gene_type:complete